MPLVAFRVARIVLLTCVVVTLSGITRATCAFAQGFQSERMTRLVWQDREKKTLFWGEMIQTGPKLIIQNAGIVQGFPKLDPKRHELVQMERVGNVLLVGVRDDDNGNLLSGWVAIDLGVDEMPHGDHSDFNYRNPPRVLASSLDKSQGNPAHLYVYDDTFFLANDQLSGFTMLNPRILTGPIPGRKGTFHRGGGAHITLAAVGGKVCYSTWIPGGGPQKGQVDVSSLQKTGKESLAYSIHLPSGGLHGATTNSGRVFFAPQDGVYWIDADLALTQKPENIKPNHISLGTDPKTKRPLRTGAFANHLNWVMFTTGQQDQSALCLLNAAAPKPTVIKVPIKTADGLSLVTPETIQAASGKRYAFVFQNKKEGTVQENLTIVDLDPNGDRDFSDATVAKTIPVGSSRVDGHYGHHSISFDDDFRWALLTNPGDGYIWILSLSDFKIYAKYKVFGMPTKLITAGGEESKH